MNKLLPLIFNIVTFAFVLNVFLLALMLELLSEIIDFCLLLLKFSILIYESASDIKIFGDALFSETCFDDF